MYCKTDTCPVLTCINAGKQYIKKTNKKYGCVGNQNYVRILLYIVT